MIPTMPSINAVGNEKIISNAASDTTGLPQPGLQSRITTNVMQPVARMEVDRLPNRDSFPTVLSGFSTFIFHDILSIPEIFNSSLVNETF
jgi:hypothetical protein